MNAWLDGRMALVVGGGPAAEAAGAALAARGAAVSRAPASLIDQPEIEAALPPHAGTFDILVHAGMPIPGKPAEQTSLQDWRAGVSADMDSRFLFAAAFVRRKLRGSGAGAILFLMPATANGAGRAAALTAHGGLDNLVKSLAVEWARDGIRVNAIASRIVGGAHDATPAQLASLGHLSAYLVSDYAAYVTGCVMGISEM